MDINNLPKTKSKEIEFIGYPSGDCDSFCWDVSKEDFIKITGNKPDYYDKAVNHNGLYIIHPNDFYGFDSPKCKMTIKIEVLESE